MKYSSYKLKDFVQIISISVKPEDVSKYERFVGLEHYDSGEPVISRYTNTDLLISSVKEFRENDILIARRNVYLRRAGIVYFSGVTSGDSIVLHIFEDCDKSTGVPKAVAIKVIPFILNSNHFWAYANKHADGMNSKRISKDMILDYEFELPPLEEQKVLADKLWAAYRLKEAYKKLLVATDEMVKSQFIEMLTKTKDRIPLSQISMSMNKGIIPKYVDSSNVVVANQACIYWDEFRFDKVKFHNPEVPIKRKLLESEDVLLNMTGSGTLGRSCLFIKPNDANVYVADSHVLVIKVNRNYIQPEIVVRYFSLNDIQGEIYRCYVTGSTNQLDIALTEIKKMLIPIPPMELQKKYVSISRQADKSKFELKQCIENIDKIIKSLING